ncbi:MAG TPA: hypothetical protein VMS89_05550 [Methanoregulaceae archaeon]|nr:hypothetical protein [Methanoregulaceae archaeon]
MVNRRERSVPWIIVSGFFGIVIFLILMAALRYFSVSIGDGSLTGIIDFIIANTAIIIIFVIFLMIAEIFYSFPFPADLPGPVFSGIGTLFFLAFIFNILRYIDRQYTIGLFPGFSLFIPLIYLIIFILILISGYVRIFTRLPRREEIRSKDPGSSIDENCYNKTWEDVGVEFRGMLYDTFHRMREEINRK